MMLFAFASAGQLFTRQAAVAFAGVIIHQAGGLHVGVDNGGAHEVEAVFLQVFADKVGQRGRCRHIRQPFEGILDGLAVDKVPDIVAEAAPLFLN